jgi:TonB family protein
MVMQRALRWLLLALGLALSLAAAAAEDEDLWIVGPQDLDKVWTMDRESWKSSIDQSAVKALGAGCAAVSFVVETDGRTSGARVLRGRPTGVYDEVAKRIADNLRFTPTAANQAAEPVFTYLTITFRGEVGGSRIGKSIRVGDSVDRLCAVAGFS